MLVLLVISSKNLESWQLWLSTRFILAASISDATLMIFLSYLKNLFN
jgi:hypothetical protein